MVLLPEWNGRTAKRELDPVGLPNGGVPLYQSLLLGISNATLRIGLTAAEVDGPAATKMRLDREFGALRGGVA